MHKIAHFTTSFKALSLLSLAVLVLLGRNIPYQLIKDVFVPSSEHFLPFSTGVYFILLLPPHCFLLLVSHTLLIPFETFSHLLSGFQQRVILLPRSAAVILMFKAKPL